MAPVKIADRQKSVSSNSYKSQLDTERDDAIELIGGKKNIAGYAQVPPVCGLSKSNRGESISMYNFKGHLIIMQGMAQCLGTYLRYKLTFLSKAPVPTHSINHSLTHSLLGGHVSTDFLVRAPLHCYYGA